MNKIFYQLAFTVMLFASCTNNSDSKSIELKKIKCKEIEDSIRLCKEYIGNTLIFMGGFVNNKPSGIHSYFNSSGKKTKILEYIYLDIDSSVLNQKYVFDDNEDTLFSESNFFEIKVPQKKISLGDSVLVYFKLSAPYFKNSEIQIQMINPNVKGEYLIIYSKDLSKKIALRPENKGKFDLPFFIFERPIGKDSTKIKRYISSIQFEVE